MIRTNCSHVAFLPLMFLFCLTACEKPADNYEPATAVSSVVASMSAQERTETVPNDLFQVVIDGTVDDVRNVIAENKTLLSISNSGAGDTALDVALKMRKREVANFLAGELLLSDFKHLNNEGESYIFLAAKAGYAEVIETLALRYYASYGGLDELFLYDFYNLDQENKLGQRALHVAADRRTAEVLSTQYWKGSLNIPYWSFTLHLDHRDQTFLHTAAAEGRTDVLLWGAEQFCDPNSWEADGGWWGVKTVVGTGLSRVAKVWQTYVGDFGVYTDLLFNRADIDGKRAIQRAIEARNIDAVRAVARCRWLDYKLEDKAGNLPLQTAVLQIPAQSEHTSEPERAIFDFMLYRETALARWWNSRPDYFNYQNKDKQSSLHLAARLADPYFYETLAIEGDIYLKDAREQTPLEIFEQRQNRVKLYGR